MRKFWNHSRAKTHDRHDRVVRGLVDALNRRDYEAAAAYLTPDIAISDGRGTVLSGRDRYLAADREMMRHAPGARIVIDSIQFREDDVLVRGHFENAPEELSGKAMWRGTFRDDLIATIDVTRAPGALTLPQFAARRAAESDDEDG